MSAYAAIAASQPAAQPTPISTIPGRSAIHTVTGLKRWSCGERNLPPVSEIKGIHVYDFDNTLFASPLPNKSLWNGPTFGTLASPDVFLNGGWWHDSSILAATGEGADKEEPRAWNGWWNEQIVSLVELSMQQKDALTVLLTGRSEGGFSDLIKRIVRSRNLEFDMVCLKPAIGPANQKFSSTMAFKQELLKEIVYTYTDAEEIRIYEDRVKHTKGFRDFFFQFNKDLMSNLLPTSRKPLVAEVIQVSENATTLEPVTELAEVQKMCNAHNLIVKSGKAPPGTRPLQIKKTVFYTGYMIPSNMTDKLTSLVKLPPGTPDGDIRYLANSILITPKPCPKSILDKVGGIGAKVTWKITGVSCFENKLWAARVEPVPSTTKYYSENPIPTIVLAIRKGGRPADAVRINNWHPVSEDQAYTFESTVGEKVLLRVDTETANESQWESYFPNKTHGKRGREEDQQEPNGNYYQALQSVRREDDRPPRNAPNSYRGGNRDRGRGGHRNTSYGSRGGRGGGRGGSSNRGRGRGGSQYKSLDDVGDKNYGQPNYDDPNGFY
ncbi:hypothetical protein BU24DRAFT_426769 [Aaosphaeria arxii CBS 175.79]|uniref:Swiss Army Knife RNA repair protein HAD domain-containing protein n=1 Tax=Aaosphaeria arxii CBS 175.79 TaxID=1450172 RepID=A0A6A5XH48_9PLEO|nr:uncharacterized protein BU24DRAFT_426769 [Aaosphaeria arxii CBS 175.79]KAF2011684.1 hypothetical protein BU24DRAFT_426769 [Aaosphaeria arxii CBS 175.79]